MGCPNATPVLSRGTVDHQKGTRPETSPQARRERASEMTPGGCHWGVLKPAPRLRNPLSMCGSDSEH
eukprot:1964520-Pyramimonas_sp.AAC.1